MKSKNICLSDNVNFKFIILLIVSKIPNHYLKKMSNFKQEISILEFGMRYSANDINNCMRDLIHYAVNVENVGLKRFWLGEHHYNSALASFSSPEMLLPVLLSETKRINIGIAGTLLNYYSPYKIAVDYKLLANIYPKRVDLGFANGKVNLPVARLLLNRRVTKSPDKFYKNLNLICQLLYDEEKMISKKLVIPPKHGLIPNCFLLTNNFDNLELAINLGLNYVKSMMHVQTDFVDELESIVTFKQRFLAKNCREPTISLAATICVAQQKRDAYEKLETITKINSGVKPLNVIFGDMDDLRSSLLRFKEQYGVNELILNDCSPSQDDKLRTLEMLDKI